MNWKNIVKAPPPRPYKPGEKKIWEKEAQPVSKYYWPRPLGSNVDYINKQIKPLITWNPYQQERPQTQALTDLEHGQTVTLRELQRDFLTESGEISIDITKLEELKDKFLKIYEQMLDDLYDWFEAYHAFTAWNKFVERYHPEENSGHKWDNHITFNFIEDQLHLLLEHLYLAKTDNHYNKSEFYTEFVNNVEKGVNEAFNLLNSLKNS